MAIFKPGGGVTGIRGSIGGNTFSANTNGNYCRTWQRSVNPRTLYQTLDRYTYQQWPAAWRALTSGQRDDWNTYAAAHPLTNPLGETFYRSGWQWFASCNQHLAVVSGSPISDAPLTEQPDTVECDGLVYDDTEVPFACAVTIPDDGFADLWCIIYARAIPYASNTSWPSNYALMRGVDDPGPGITDIDIDSQHALKWGYPALGWKLFVRVCAMNDDGLRSAPWEASIEYTEP